MERASIAQWFIYSPHELGVTGVIQRSSSLSDEVIAFSST